ncbi:MAG: hypothetical protein PHV18_08880 [Lachnospiraceae bacterium]|nr:hypothetical protein [Lachnospiraceae bacterium]
MKLGKKITVLAMVSLFTIGAANIAFAGTWKNGAEPNQEKWWYDNGDGTSPSNGWQWIDGNADGISESYYFDSNGWLLADTTTPDGYTVNEKGAWVQNGIVQTKTVSVASANKNVTGTYNYLYTAVYVFNAEIQNYELYGKTPENTVIFDFSEEDWIDKYNPLMDERFKLEQAADFAVKVYVEGASDDKIKVHHNNSELSEFSYFANQGSQWNYVGYEYDGTYTPQTSTEDYILFSDDSRLIWRSDIVDNWGNFLPKGSRYRVELVYTKE